MRKFSIVIDGVTHGYSNKQHSNIAIWIKALLSGDYKYGRERLYNPKTKCHCAVGVLAEEMGLPRIGGGYLHMPEVVFGDLQFYSTKLLPWELAVRYIGDYVYLAGIAHVSDMFGFAQVADQLVCYLPEGPIKTELAKQVYEALVLEEAIKAAQQKTERVQS